MKKTIVAALTLLSAVDAYAGDALAGKLSKPHFMADGVVIVHTDGARSNAPSCVSDLSRFAVDATTPQGKAQLAGLLAAFSTGQRVRIVGTGTATNCLYGEWINYFYIEE